MPTLVGGKGRQVYTMNSGTARGIYVSRTKTLTMGRLLQDISSLSLRTMNGVRAC